jgi:hypothetical protein
MKPSKERPEHKCARRKCLPRALHPWLNFGNDFDESIFLIIYIVVAQKLIEINEEFWSSGERVICRIRGLIRLKRVDCISNRFILTIQFDL